MDSMRKLLNDMNEILSNNQKAYSDMESNLESEDPSMVEDEILDMVLSSLRSISNNAASILANVNLDRVQKNLTEPWVLGMIAVVEDNIRNVHDYVKFSGEASDRDSALPMSVTCENCGAVNELGADTLMEEEFTCSVCKTMSTIASQSRPGLWENIRKKREREGKDYKPAKRGDKDRPDSDQWNKLTKENKKKK
jgi:hypothetical protein